MQAAVTEDEQFKLDFSKRIINAKIRNQIVILRRYARNQEADIQRAVIEMVLCQDLVQVKMRNFSHF